VSDCESLNRLFVIPKNQYTKVQKCHSDFLFANVRFKSKLLWSITWRIRNALQPQSEVQIKSKMAAPLGRHATFGLIKMPFECLSNQLGFFILHPPKVKGR